MRLSAAALAAALPLLAAPGFPIVVTGTDCVGASCFDTTWTLRSNGTFSERAGLDGTYRLNRNMGSQGGLQLTYGNATGWPYIYRGLKSGSCLSGSALDQGLTVVGGFDACLVPPVDGFDYPVGAPNAVGYYNAQGFTVSGHCGEDWNGNGGGATNFGDPVYATAHGVVRFADDAGSGWGDTIVVVHAIPGAADVNYEAIESQYAHLSTMYVSQGDVVQRGQVIGAIGDANGAWVPHLHFEMRWDEHQPAGGNGYDCPNTSTGMFDPSDFIDAHRIWP